MRKVVPLPLVLALAALASGWGGALAQEPSPCQSEARMRCGAVEDPGERERCIVEREMECEAAGPRHHPREAAHESTLFRGACRADFERLCADLGSDANRKQIVECLKAHRAELSPDCREALEP